MQPGATVGISVEVTPTCEGAGCECPMGDSACALTGITSDGDVEWGDRSTTSVEFVHDSADPVELDLAAG